MKRWFLTALFAAMLVFSVPGCHEKESDETVAPVTPVAPVVQPTKPTKPQDIDPTVLTAVRFTAQAGTQVGFKQWAKKNPDLAKDTAATTVKMTDDLIAYFKDDSKLKTAQEAQNVLQMKLFDKLVPEVKIAVIAAFAVLDVYLPIPSSTTYLNKNQTQLIVAFLTGVHDGAQASMTKFKSVNTSWFPVEAIEVK